MYIYSITALYINPHYHDCTKFQYDVSVFFFYSLGAKEVIAQVPAHHHNLIILPIMLVNQSLVLAVIKLQKNLC